MRIGSTHVLLHNEALNWKSRIEICVSGCFEDFRKLFRMVWEEVLTIGRGKSVRESCRGGLVVQDGFARSDMRFSSVMKSALRLLSPRRRLTEAEC